MTFICSPLTACVQLLQHRNLLLARVSISIRQILLLVVKTRRKKMASYYIGVDVGTTSVRACTMLLQNWNVRVIDTSTREIEIWNELPDHYEQSSDDIWAAVVTCVKNVIAASKLTPSDVGGIGFDATCSLVALDTKDSPISVSLSKERARNIIMWMDHRAGQQMEEINATGHYLLNYIGGKVSIEMEMPKILWLKQNLSDTWDGVGALMDLPDFLTHKATSSNSRSLCSLVCKMMYDASEGDMTNHSWSEELLSSIGLAELADSGYGVIGSQVLAPGQAVSNGLSEKAAEEFGLNAGTPVGASLIDAHAGAVGMLVSKPSTLEMSYPISNKLGLICGTSNCFMIVSEQPIFIPGVWGPYYSALVPGLWLNEGGQSATGKLIDHIIQTHPAYGELMTTLDGDSSQCYSHLASHAHQLAEDRHVTVHELTRDLHILPDFHGNRSPLADPIMKGMISGLTLTAKVDQLALMYVATLQSLALGTRYTVDAMTASGHDVSAVYMCGGLTKNVTFVQMHADILGRPVIIPSESQSVLLGAALLGVSAALGPLSQVIEQANCDGQVYHPNTDTKPFYDKKYQVLRRMVDDHLAYREIMDQ